MSERGQARRTRHLALSRPSVRRKRHESAMNSVIGRDRGTALLPPGTGESHEGCSHASSTSQSTLVAHPVGRAKLLGNRHIYLYALLDMVSFFFV